MVAIVMKSLSIYKNDLNQNDSNSLNYIFRDGIIINFQLQNQLLRCYKTNYCEKLRAYRIARLSWNTHAILF